MKYINMTTNDESTTGSRIFMSNLPYAWILVRQKKHNPTSKWAKEQRYQRLHTF